MQTPSRIDTFVGLHVTDDASYREYRDGVKPLLEAHGGTLHDDCRIEESRRAVEHPMNRLFIISFPDANAKRAFFENESFRQMHARYFDPERQGITTVAHYEMSEN